MSVLLAFLATQAATIDATYPLTVFESLCLRGQARFHQGEMREVSWRETPILFRSALAQATLNFSNRAAAKKVGLDGNLPGFKGGAVILGTDGNWAATVQPKGEAGDQRCAIVAKVIDRVAVRRFGPVPLEFFLAQKKVSKDDIQQWWAAGSYPGAIVRIGVFGQKGALIQAYIMSPAAAEADRRSLNRTVRPDKPGNVVSVVH